MKTRTSIKLFLFGLLVITPVFHLNEALDVALVPRFICWSVILLLGAFLLLKAEKETKYLNILDVSFLLYYFITGLSLIWATNSANAIFEIQRIFATLVTYLLLRFLLLQTEGRAIRFLLFCNLLITLIVLTVVGWQIIEHGRFNNLIARGFDRISGLSAQRNLLCSFLYLTLVFNVFSCVYNKSRQWQFAYLLPIAMQTAILLLFQTRSVYIALFISGLFFLFGFQFITKFFNLKRALVFLGIPVLLTAGILTSLTLVNDNFKGYLEKIDVTQYTESNSAQERIMMWKRTVKMIREYPLTGVGAGNWAAFYPSEDTEVVITSKKYVFFQRPHNDFLWVFSETGILGFLVYLSLFVLILIPGIQVVKKNETPDKSLKVLILIIGLIGYFTIANFSFPKERIEHQIWFVLMLSMLAYYLHDQFKNKFRLSLIKVNNAAIIGVLLTGLCFNLLIGYYRYQGEKAMKPVYTRKMLPQKKLELLDKAQSYFYNTDPVGFPLDWHRGITLNIVNQKKEALPYFIKAYKLNPNNFRVVDDLAAAYGTDDQPKEAIRYFEIAHKLDTKGEATIYNLAILNYRIKAYTVALDWAKKLPSDYLRRDELIGELTTKLTQ